jgi:hypothetical protein
MRRKKSTGDYLAYLTVKYDVHPDILFCAMLSAGEIGKAKCGKLSVEYRCKIEDKLYFLFKEGSEVVSQFPVDEEFLSRQRNPIRNFMETDSVQGYKSHEHEKAVYSFIGDLKPGMRHVNLKAIVVDVSEPIRVGTRYGNLISLAKALLKDETGEINLCLWRDQIEAVSAGNLVEIHNGTVSKFKDKTQMSVGNKGKLEIIDTVSRELKSAVTEKNKI